MMSNSPRTDALCKKYDGAPHGAGEVAFMFLAGRLERLNAELIEVLRELDDLCPRMSDDDPIAPAIADALRRARAAIAKAEGK